MMKILVLGGSGAMGIHLVDILSKDSKNKIFVTSRKERSSHKENVSYIKGNAKEKNFVTALLNKKDWDAIVDFMVYSTEEFKERTELFLSSCRQYVFLSSSRVYAESKEPITEKSPRLLDISNDEEYLATDESALAKARQENILFDSTHKNWTIIRPYITYSENRLQLGVMEKESWLFTALKCGALVFSKDIAEHTTTLTYGYDVARGIAALIGKENACGEAFHITGNSTIKWQKVFEIYSETLRKNGIDFEEMLKEKSFRLNGYGKYQVIYDRYFDRIFDNFKIAQFLDVSTFVKPEDGLKNCLEVLIQNPVFNSIPVNEVLQNLHGTKGKLHIKDIADLKQKIKIILIKMHLYQFE